MSFCSCTNPIVQFPPRHNANIWRIHGKELGKYGATALQLLPDKGSSRGICHSLLLTELISIYLVGFSVLKVHRSNLKQTLLNCHYISPCAIISHRVSLCLSRLCLSFPVLTRLLIIPLSLSSLSAFHVNILLKLICNVI